MTALFSSTESTGKQSASSNIVPPFGHCVCQSDDKTCVRQTAQTLAMNPSCRAMTTAFIRWHVTGCFAAAADYHKARQAWELALMEKDSVA